VNGTAKCDVTKPPSSGYDIDIKNKKCTAVCTKEHEDQHAKDRQDCCDKARKALQDKKEKARADAIALYRSWGLSTKTMARKLKEIESGKDKRVNEGIRQATYDVSAKWVTYRKGSSAWAECRAYGVSIACADRLWKEKNCDCPAPEDKKCCKDIKSYKKNAERQKDKNCKKKGAKNPPKCPF
jgi:hypothetical protein